MPKRTKEEEAVERQPVVNIFAVEAPYGPRCQTSQRYI